MARSSFTSCTIHNNDIYFFGGKSKDKYLIDLLKFNISEKEFTNLNFEFDEEIIGI